MNLVKMSLAATFATIPIVAYHFGEASYMGIFFNPIAVPLICFYSLMTSLLGAALFVLWEGGAQFLWAAGGAGVDLLISIQREALPLGGTFEGPFDNLPAVAGGLLLAGTAFFSARGKLSPRKGGAIALVALSLIFLPAPAGELLRMADNRAHGWVFDVGNGQSVAFRLPRKGMAPPAVVLIDGGGFPSSSFDVGESVIMPALGHLGMDKIDYLVSSHPHPDHLKGLVSCVRLGRPETVFLPEYFKDDHRYRPLLEAAGETGSLVRWIGGEGLREEIGDTSLLISPSQGESENDCGLVVEIQYGQRRFLVPGDIEYGGQARLAAKGNLSSADIMVAPHHGSSDAVNEDYFEAVAPSVILVSAGARRSLPSARLVDVAGQIGARIVSTRETGAIHLVFDGDSYQLGSPAR